MRTCAFLVGCYTCPSTNAVPSIICRLRRLHLPKVCLDERPIVDGMCFPQSDAFAHNLLNQSVFPSPFRRLFQE
jgi:hypothetical protein